MNQDEKYTVDFFEKRIVDLSAAIKDQIPEIDEALKTSFSRSCDALQDASAALAQARKVLDQLTKSKADESLIDEAKEQVDKCTTTEEACTQVLKSCAQPIIDSFNLEAGIDSPELLECTILVQSTPKGMAEWVQENVAKNSPLLDSFLSNPDWMKQMLVGGGASNGNYGKAVTIHHRLLKELHDSEKETTPMRHKIALAVALEHASPIKIFKKGDATVDPIGRFWHYVNAYEDGQLDVHFDTFSVWELRMIVDANSETEELTWCREYMKAYRPDEIRSMTDRWIYIWASRSDIGYRQREHEYNNYKEMLSAGGKCGPRAFFARFAAKAWGNCTWGVKQPGHAAVSRWTPSGWTVCLGAAFKYSRWDDKRYGKSSRSGPDFLEETQARAVVSDAEYFDLVVLLECLAESLGETIEEQVTSAKVWRSLALTQRNIFASREAQPRSPPNNRKKQKQRREKPVATGNTENTVFIIPASTYSECTKANKKVMRMNSWIQGTQLYLERDGSVTYNMPSIIPSGRYRLTAKIVNVHQKQLPLELSIGPSRETIRETCPIRIPYTGGKWSFSEPIDIEWNHGEVLIFGRPERAHGLSIKEFQFEKI